MRSYFGRWGTRSRYHSHYTLSPRRLDPSRADCSQLTADSARLHHRTTSFALHSIIGFSSLSIFNDLSSPFPVSHHWPPTRKLTHRIRIDVYPWSDSTPLQRIPFLLLHLPQLLFAATLLIYPIYSPPLFLPYAAS